MKSVIEMKMRMFTAMRAKMPEEETPDRGSNWEVNAKLNIAFN